MARRRIILATVGSLGDLHPFIAIGLALRKLGAAPILAVPHDHVAACRAVGLDAEAILPPFAELGKATGLDEAEIVRRIMADINFLVEGILLPSLEDSVERLVDMAREADVVVGSIFALAAPIAAQAAAVPYVSAVLQPMSWFSASDPPTAPGFGGLIKSPANPVALGWNRALYAAMGSALKLRYARRIDAVRARYGLPPSATPPILRPGTHPALSLGLYSNVLAQLPGDAPGPAEVTGFPWFDGSDGAGQTLEEDLLAFVTNGTPPLVVSLGSFVPFGARQFYAQVAGAISKLGMRAVLLTASDPGVRLANIKVTAYAPHSLLFPHVDAIVHHGGIGTSGQALRAGKAQIIVPFMGDQFDNARRLEALEVSVTCKPGRFARTGASILRQFLENNQFREAARDAAANIAREDGARSAAFRILGIA